MENQSTEQKRPLTNRSPIETQRAERLGWIVDQLSLAAVAKGQTCSPERLRINAEDLIDIPKAALEGAFAKARRECDFIPGVSELRRLAGVSEEGTIDAEARAAWEMLEIFVKRYVDCDVLGNYGPEFGWYPKTYPLLSERIMGTVRRTGGWPAYKLMTGESFPFQQKRFFDEYKAFAAVERATDNGRLLMMPQRKELAAAAEVKREKTAEKPVAQAVIKAVPPELSAAETKDRREILRQQAEKAKQMFGKKA